MLLFVCLDLFCSTQYFIFSDWSKLCRILFYGAFAKLRKATISFVLSVRPSVCPHGKKNSALTGRIFMKFYFWVPFENLSRTFKFSLKSGKNNEYFTWRPLYIYIYIYVCVCVCVCVWSYLAEFEWEMFQTKAVEKIKESISCSLTFFPRKYCSFWDNMAQYGGVGQATDNNMVHAQCMLGT
jgi:hypothetical protein